MGMPENRLARWRWEQDVRLGDIEVAHAIARMGNNRARAIFGPSRVSAAVYRLSAVGPARRVNAPRGA